MTGNLKRLESISDGWLIDTNIISATIGSKTLPEGISRFFSAVADERLRLSVITIGEIRKGIELLPRGEKLDVYDFRVSLKQKLGDLQERWLERILPVDTSVANQWGMLLAKYQRSGSQLPVVDALIAATASVHNLVVVSHDSMFGRISEVLHYDPLA